MTWNSPNLPSGIDDFTRKQEPNPQPVDDLSRFVLDRIRKAENEPRVDGIPQNYYRTGMAIAHRYATGMRQDMAAFRRIVAAYCEARAAAKGVVGADGVVAEGMADGLETAVLEIANRWSGHEDFRDEWRLQ